MSTSPEEAKQIARGNIGSGCTEGHTCTSGCGNDYDCPCQSEHCCDESEELCGECDYCKWICPECEERKEGDERVKVGMKCGQCAYGAEMYQEAQRLTSERD